MPILNNISTDLVREIKNGAIMIKTKKYSTRSAWFYFMMLIFSALIYAQEMKVCYIVGRVIDVSNDGRTVIINRGSTDNILVDSLCTLRPNRGGNQANVQWDILLARGEITELYPDSAIILLNYQNDSIRIGDCCELYAKFPSFVIESDIGRIAAWDVMFIEYENKKPIFKLSDLVNNPSPSKIDSIVTALVAEVHYQAELGVYYSEKIMGGMFAGLTVTDGCKVTERKHLELFLEYVRYFPGRYINRDWELIWSYANWMIYETPSAEHEKKLNVLAPIVDTADSKIKEGDFQRAINYYKRALSIMPDYSYASERLEYVSNILQNLKIIEEDSNDVMTSYELGKSFYELDRYDDAFKYLQKARKLGYDSTEVDLYIGYVSVAQQKYTDARKIFEYLKILKPKDTNINRWLKYSTAREKQGSASTTAEWYIMTGDLRYEWENYDAAISEYQKALALEPDSHKIIRLIEKTAKRRDAHQRQIWAKEYWDIGDFDHAKNFWKEALELCEEIGDTTGIKSVLNEKADAMYNSTFYDDAIEVYKQIIDIAPEMYDAHISISNCYKEKGDYHNAIIWVEKGIQVKPEEAWGYNILGFIYLKINKIAEAIGNFLEACRLDSMYKYPNYNLGMAFIKKKDYENARKYLRRALEIDKDYWDARYDLMNIETVLETSQKLRENPDDIESRVRFARALYFVDEYEQAIIELNRVIARDKSNVDALSYLGYSYTQIEKYNEGKKYLEMAYMLNPAPNLKAWLLYNEAKDALAKNPNAPEAHMKYGDGDLYWEYFDTALAHFGIALQFGADSLLVYQKITLARKGKEAKKLLDIAVDYFNRAEYEKGIEYADSALALYRKIDDKTGKMWALFRLGWCYAGLFNHNQALSYYKQAGEVAEESGDEINKAHYLSGIGDYYWNIGDFITAIKYKTEAQTLYYKNIELINEAGVIAAIGALTGNIGEFDKMMENYKKALDIHEKTMNYTGESYVLNNMGWAYQEDGDYAMALEYETRALKVAHKYNDKWQEMLAYQGIGNIYEDLGDTVNAIKYFQYYSDAATAIGSKTDRVNAMIGLGLAHLDITKDYDKAYSYFNNAQELSKTIGYPMGEAVAAADIGVTYSRRKKYQEALQYNDEAFRIIDSLNMRYQKMQGFNERGEIYLGLKRYDEALDCHLKAIALAETIGVRREKWSYEFNAGKVFEEKNEFAKAIEYYKKAIETLAGIKNKIKSENLRKDFSEQEKQTEVYKRLIDLLIKKGKPDEAIKYIEESKSKTIKDVFGDVKPKTADEDLKQTLDAVDKIEKQRETLEKKLAEEKQKPVEEQDKIKLEILSNTLATTEGEFNQWMLKLKFQNRKMYDALTINPATLGDIQNDIPENILLLEYFISPDKLYIFCIGKKYFVAKSVEVSETELNNTVEYHLSLIRNHQPDMNEELYDAAMRLYKYLIKPIEQEIKDFENIIVVPFGVLYYLPFHSLMRDNNGKKQYLIEYKRLSYTTSATLADLLKPERRGINNLLAIGNPDGSLPGASHEVQEVKDEIFKQDAIIWTLSEATKQKFLEQAKNYNIVHLATHGYIQHNPLESYLLFAGNTEKEQRLTLLEVAGYTSLRERTDLVFLSACQTAMEKGGTTGSELISLAEAFAMAGPPTLIATLWPVNDVSTSKLVISFYSELKKNKEDKLGALRDAQISLLKSEEFSHPFYWAPFILLGDWR